jgi:hypothetical protein
VDPYRSKILNRWRSGLLADVHETYVSPDGGVVLAPYDGRGLKRRRIHSATQRFGVIA